MTEYVVDIGFWLRAHDNFTVEAASDTEAIETAKAAARVAMRSGIVPSHVDYEERREGIISFIDRVTPQGREAVIEDLEFENPIPDPPIL